MYFRLFSDTHYEHTFNAQHRTRPASSPYPEFWAPSELPTDSETVLILAGDLWNGLRSLDVIKTFNKRFKKVLIVLGNHDYWGENIISFASDYWSEIITRGLYNVELLDRTKIEIDGVLFVGATLWTDMGKDDALTKLHAEQYMMADFNQINKGEEFSEHYISRKIKFRSNDWVSINRTEFQYIKAITELNKDKKVVIVVHHAPTFLSVHERFKNSGLANNYFASDYSEFILDNPHIKYICHGHMHSPVNVHIGETKIIANPYGYPGENQDFDPISLYEI